MTMAVFREPHGPIELCICGHLRELHQLDHTAQTFGGAGGVACLRCPCEGYQAAPDVETLNMFVVGGLGQNVAICNPPRGPLTRAQALNLAVYLFLVSGASWEEFARVYIAIRDC